MVEKYWSPIYKFFKTNLLYVNLIVAIILLIIAYSFELGSFVFDSLKSLGFTLISGGVFAVIVKSEQFSKIFHDELRNIIYGDEELKKRNDLDVLWEKVTKALCNQKFKLISKKLHEGVKNYYLPINHEFYYKNHNVEILIELDKEKDGYVYVTETTKATIISDDTQEICFKFSNKIPMIKDEEEFSDYKLLSFSVNGTAIALSDKELSVEKKDGFLTIKGDHFIKGKTKYVIIRKEKKRYSLKVNPYRQHYAIWLYDNFYLELNYPKEIDVEFIEMGVVNKWKLENSNIHSTKRLKAEYSGLIFKKQGFILLLNKN